MLQVGFFRAAVDNYHQDHPTFVRLLESKLGRVTSSAERLDMHMALERQINDYLKVVP